MTLQQYLDHDRMSDADQERLRDIKLIQAAVSSHFDVQLSFAEAEAFWRWNSQQRHDEWLSVDVTGVIEAFPHYVESLKAKP